MLRGSAGQLYKYSPVVVHDFPVPPEPDVKLRNAPWDQDEHFLSHYLLDNREPEQF